MAVQELKTRRLPLQLVEESRDAEIAATLIGVVKQHDGAFRQFWPPRVEVVTGRLVGVVAVDVQEVDRRVGEVAVRLVEGLAQELRKRAVASVVALCEFQVDVVA